MLRRFVWGTVLVAGTMAPTSAPADEVPRALKCIARWYAIHPVQSGDRWYAELPDGTRIPYDRRPVEADGELEAVVDIFSERYRPGPIVAVTTVDEDPGAIRLDRIFKATYGQSEAKIDLVRIEFVGQSVQVHRRVADAFRKVDARLRPLLAKQPSLKPFVTGLGGTFNWRNIAGTTDLSSHSFGTAIDLNPKRSNYWQWSGLGHWKNAMPQAIVDAFEAEGFIWGGRWYHYDTMHFEYRPELLDASCYPEK